MEGQVDLVGMLDALEHVIRLPPGDVLVVVEVGEVIGRMGRIGHTDVAYVARLFRSFGARLRAKLAGTVEAARVGRLHHPVEGRVHKVGNASLLVSVSKSSHYFSAFFSSFLLILYHSHFKSILVAF